MKAAWYEKQGLAREVLKVGDMPDPIPGSGEVRIRVAASGIGVFFLGRDDFPKEAKIAATKDLNGAIEGGWPGFEIGERIPLSEIARAHELVEHPVHAGRVVVTL
jgi:NADPH:quinone reductase-like Zn-dependent oxidoreductase